MSNAGEVFESQAYPKFSCYIYMHGIVEVCKY